MQREPVQSSLIKSIVYDKPVQVLQIEFVKGHVRDYQNIPYDLYQRFINAESKGKFYLEHIRKKFDYSESK